MGDEPDLAADALGGPGAVVTGDGRGSTRRAYEGREDLEQRRLAGPVGAEHRHGLADPDVQIEAVQHAMVAEGLAETGHSDEWISGHASTVDCRRATGTGSRKRQLASGALPAKKYPHGRCCKPHRRSSD